MNEVNHMQEASWESIDWLGQDNEEGENPIRESRKFNPHW